MISEEILSGLNPVMLILPSALVVEEVMSVVRLLMLSDEKPGESAKAGEHQWCEADAIGQEMQEILQKLKAKGSIWNQTDGAVKNDADEHACSSLSESTFGPPKCGQPYQHFLLTYAALTDEAAASGKWKTYP